MSENELTGRKILLSLSLKYNGDWEEIYEAIKRKEPIDRKEISEVENRIKCKYVTIIDPEYPSYLKTMNKPPFVLYYYGDFSLAYTKDANLTVVGTRRPTSYGVESTTSIIKGLKKITIVSGMAAGIDGIAHRTALDNNFGTIAVLCCGIDLVYPKENILIYNEIKNKGLLLSEYPGDVFPEKDKIPFRNRILASLSKVTLVTEAFEKSGTSITVNYALGNGNDVAAVPNRIDSDATFTNYLIKSGACCVTSPVDVQELYTIR